MIKLFEDFNEIDPFGEENWDDDKKRYARCKRDYLSGTLLIFRGGVNYEIMKENDNYVHLIVGEIDSYILKYILNRYEFNQYFDIEINEELKKISIKTFEKFSEIDPYGEENWNEDDGILYMYMKVVRKYFPIKREFRDDEDHMYCFTFSNNKIVYVMFERDDYICISSLFNPLLIKKLPTNTDLDDLQLEFNFINAMKELDVPVF